jgi:hypothetical protein
VESTLGFDVGLGGCLLGEELPQVAALAVELDGGEPALAASVPVDAEEAARPATGSSRRFERRLLDGLPSMWSIDTAGQRPWT